MTTKTHLLSLLAALCLVPACTLEHGSVPGGGGSDDSAIAERIYSTPDVAPVSYEVADETRSLGTGDLTVLFVVDRSGSMASPWEGSSTKWNITLSAVQSAIVGVEEELTAGALFFPAPFDALESSSTESCMVEPLHDESQLQFQRGASFGEGIDAMASAPDGATPMGAAFRQAGSAVEQAVVDGALDDGKRLRVVILTDGEPNCATDPEELVDTADAWREMGVEVAVMGLPGSESARILLDRIAGKEVDPNAPQEAPVETWTPDDADAGYVAPESSEDVDDSMYLIVR